MDVFKQNCLAYYEFFHFFILQKKKVWREEKHMFSHLFPKLYCQKVRSKELVGYQENTFIPPCWVLLMWASCSFVNGAQSLTSTPVEEQLLHLYGFFKKNLFLSGPLGGSQPFCVQYHSSYYMRWLFWLVLIQKAGRGHNVVMSWGMKSTDRGVNGVALWQCKMLKLLFTTVPQSALPVRWCEWLSGSVI